MRKRLIRYFVSVRYFVSEYRVDPGRNENQMAFFEARKRQNAKKATENLWPDRHIGGVKKRIERNRRSGANLVFSYGVKHL